MGVDVLIGDEALGPEVQAGWEALSAACPWTTPYSCPALALGWYEAFKDRFEPVVVYERSRDGGLEGLLPLARDRFTDALVPAVNYQASVHGWLALPLRGSFFLERALLALEPHFPGRVLTFAALPEAAPTDWTARGRPLGRRTRLASARHWLMPLSAERAGQKLDKKANSNQLAGLKKDGGLRMVRALDAPALQDALPTLTAWYDANAVDSGRPPRFRPHPTAPGFWGRMPGCCPGFAASALYVGDVLSAAVLGFTVGRRYHIAWGAENPSHESFAPSQVLWLMLEEELLQAGLQDADVTAGFDWMRQGGAEAKDTLQASIYFDRGALAMHDARRLALDVGRWALKLLDSVRP
jgi:hypothetical protein